MTQDQTKKYNWYLLFGFWGLLSIAFLARSFYNSQTTPLLADTDDAMRLTVIRDWLGGQNWLDHTQYRLNTPFGADIHWSRLIDVPIAVLMALFSIFSPAHGETIALYVWPLLLLFGLLCLTSWLSVYLAGPDAQLPGLALPVFSVAIMAEFAPGRIDHHNVQTLLTMAIVLASVLAWKHRHAAIWAGIAASTSLAIGTEGLPFIAAAIICFGLIWVVDGSRGDSLLRFGLSFAASAITHLVIAVPPPQYFTAHCDALSIVFVGAAIGVGLVFVILAFLPVAARHWSLRLAIGITMGTILCAILLVLFPNCIAGPYADLDPWLVENWLAGISEAKPVWTSFTALPAYTLGLALPPLFALLALSWRMMGDRSEKRAEWLILGLFLLFAVLTFVLQVRGARLAATLAVPAGAWVILMARRQYLKKTTLISITGLLTSWLAFSGLPITLALSYVFPPLASPSAPTSNATPVTAFNRAECAMPPAFDALAQLETQPIMAPIDLGAHILAYTAHSVVAAPYHRDQQGVRDAFRFFNGSEADALGILQARDIWLVVICPSLPELSGVGEIANDSIVSGIAAGSLPDWLSEIPTSGETLRIYKVLDVSALR